MYSFSSVFFDFAVFFELGFFLDARAGVVFADFVGGFLIFVDFLEEGFEVGKLDLGFYGEIEGAFADGFVDGGAGDVDGVSVGAAMELDFVGELDAVDGAVVVVENFLGRGRRRERIP